MDHSQTHQALCESYTFMGAGGGGGGVWVWVNALNPWDTIPALIAAEAP